MLHEVSLLVLTALIAYGTGSIPFGLLLTALAGKGDIRHIGSGNIGATNVLRTGRKDIAAATLLLDALKGAIPVFLIRIFCPEQTQLLMAIAGIAAVSGHCFPLWLKFRGGKGVATGIGTLWALCLPAGLACTVIWLAGIKLSRISSVGALLAFMSAPLLTPALATQPISAPLPVATDIIALIVWGRHYGNLVRLLKGTEPRVRSKR